MTASQVLSPEKKTKTKIRHGTSLLPFFFFNSMNYQTSLYDAANRSLSSCEPKRRDRAAIFHRTLPLYYSKATLLTYPLVRPSVCECSILKQQQQKFFTSHKRYHSLVSFFLIFLHCKIWRNGRVQGLRPSRLYDSTAGIAVSPATTAYK